MEITLNNGKQITIETSWDDGSRYDIRLRDLLMQYHLPGTFYVPTYTRELTEQQIQDLALTHDIGGHTQTHQILRLMPPAAEQEEIEGCKADLERIIGRAVTSFCPPKGKYNQGTIDKVKAAGFTEMRTVDVLSTYVTDDPFRKKTTIHVFQRREYEGEHWTDVAKRIFNVILNEAHSNNYFHLWGHGWEIEQQDEWKNLETFMKYMDERLPRKWQQHYQAV